MKTHYIMKAGHVGRLGFVRAGLRSGALLGMVLVAAGLQAVAENAAVTSGAVAMDKPQGVKNDDKQAVKDTLTKISDISPSAVATALEAMQKRGDRATAEKARDNVGSAERKALKEQYQARLAQAQNEAERESLLIEYETLQRSLAAEAELRQTGKIKN